MVKHALARIAVIVLTLVMASVSLTDVPQFISFQGKLYDSEGNPLNGKYEITFRMYDVEEGGTTLWTEKDSVSCEEGLYHIILGLTTLLNLGFDGQYWLGVQVTGDDELSPRYRLVSVPTAFRAQIANQVSWINLTDVPAGFADGTDDVGVAGGVSQINEGTGINVTNPTGPTTTVAADIGTGNNQVAAGNHSHDGVYSPSGHNHDSQYVNEGQSNSITSSMIANGTIQQEDLSFSPGSDNDWTISGGNIYRGTGNVGIGTTSPEYPLTAAGDSNDPVVMATNDGYGHAVWGKNADNFGSGVYGEGTGHMGEGVYGKHSNGNYGYLGDDDHGVYGENVHDGPGVHGKGDGGSGVSGESNSGRGVFGFSTNGDGVYGFNIGSLNHGLLGGSSHGVYGENYSSGSYGYLGGDAYGTFGRHSVGNYGYLGGYNHGVYGYSFSEYAVYGATHNGWAGYFDGKTYMEGNVGIGTTSPDDDLHVADHIRVGEDPTYSNVFGELIHDGGGTGFKINAHAGGGGWADIHFQTNRTTRMFIESGGNVGIGTTSPGYRLDVAGAAHASSFPTSSDARFKKNVTRLTDTLKKLEKIRGVSFQWNELYESLGRSTGHWEIGLIAQEVEAIFPELVTTWGDEDYKAVDYGRMTGVLIEAIKEQQTQIETLKAENEELRRDIKDIRRILSR